MRVFLSLVAKAAASGRPSIFFFCYKDKDEHQQMPQFEAVDQ